MIDFKFFDKHNFNSNFKKYNNFYDQRRPKKKKYDK